jgi:hypothetical protein
MRFFNWWAGIITRYPAWVAGGISLTLIAVFSTVALLAPKDLSFTGMLDEANPNSCATARPSAPSAAPRRS